MTAKIRQFRSRLGVRNVAALAVLLLLAPFATAGTFFEQPRIG